MPTLIQILGVLGCIFISGSYIQKRKPMLLLFQTIGCIAFSAHYLLLGAWIGALMNGIGIFRGVAFRRLGVKSRAINLALVVIFSAIFLACYALTFLVFGTEPTLHNFLVESLPVLAMLLTTFLFTLSSAARIRVFLLIVSPLWMAYNIFHGSIGGIICECINLVAILLGIFLVDRKARQAKEDPHLTDKSEL